MKLKIKRVMLAVCMVTCLFLSACSTKEQAASDELDPMLSQSLDQIAQAALQQFTAMDEEQYPLVLSQAEKSGNTVLVSALTSWNGMKDELGEFVSIDDVEVKKAEGGYAVSVSATFQERALTFDVGIDEEITEYTSMSFSPVYTTGENLARAGMNTLMGMGTVFIVLIFISLLIGCFKYINEFEKKNKAQKEAVQIAPAPAPAAAPVVEEEEELADDLELVAVITAAIAASANTSTDGLVVRSIRRAPAAKWKKA